MSPILGIWASPKYVAPSNYYSIATATVTSGGTASITFSSIPSTYTHLQLRGFVRMNRADYADNLSIRFNSDSSSNYYSHGVRGDGTNVNAWASGTSTYNYIDDMAANSALDRKSTRLNSSHT